MVDEPDPFVLGEERASLRIGLEIDAVRGLAGRRRNHEFEASVTWEIRSPSSGTVLAQMTGQALLTPEDAPGPPRVGSDIEVVWDGTDMAGEEVTANRSYPYGVSVNGNTAPTSRSPGTPFRTCRCRWRPNSPTGSIPLTIEPTACGSGTRRTRTSGAASSSTSASASRRVTTAIPEASSSAGGRVRVLRRREHKHVHDRDRVRKGGGTVWADPCVRPEGQRLMLEYLRQIFQGHVPGWTYLPARRSSAVLMYLRVSCGMITSSVYPRSADT